MRARPGSHLPPPRRIVLTGPPRSGTTLLARLLADSAGVLALSEPFLAHAVLPPWRLRRFLSRLQRAAGLKRVPLPPCPCSPQRFGAFLGELAARNDRPVLLIKETFRDLPGHAAWANVALLEGFAAGGVPIVTIVRHPYDATASALRLLRWFVGWRGWLSQKVALADCPRFAGSGELACWFARNWQSCLGWARRRSLTLLRYEDLVRDPAGLLGPLCRSCDLPFDPRRLERPGAPAGLAGIGAPEVIDCRRRPVHRRSLGRGRALPAEIRRTVRQLTAECAAELGYRL